MWGLGNKKSIDRFISGDGVVLDLTASRVWRPWSIANVLLRLNLVLLSSEISYHTSDAVLELAVLGGVDERVDTTVGVHQNLAEVEEPVNSFYLLIKKTEKCTWWRWWFQLPKSGRRLWRWLENVLESILMTYIDLVWEHDLILCEYWWPCNFEAKTWWNFEYVDIVGLENVLERISGDRRSVEGAEVVEQC